MLNRLFIGLHWIVYLAFFGIWTLFFLSLIIGSADKVYDELEKLLTNDENMGAIIFSGAMTWIPILFLLIDYLVYGKWTLFPWQRGK